MAAVQTRITESVTDGATEAARAPGGGFVSFVRFRTSWLDAVQEQENRAADLEKVRAAGRQVVSQYGEALERLAE